MKKVYKVWLILFLIYEILLGLSLFVECHRNILHIEHEESFHCLELAKQQNTCNNQHTNYRLTQLQSTKRTLNPELYEYTVDYCPNLGSVLITSPGNIILFL
jgi:hypothetical protein